MKLLASSGASQMRFWGKIKGTEFDYFIVEGKLEGGGDEGGDGEEGGGGAQEAGFEARGTGANEYVYWVCNSLLEHWVKLPDVKPSQIKKARCIKFNFTGDVERRIFTNPFYFDKEAIYLRAQIARINASTTIVPSSLYRFVPESTRDIEDNAPEEGEVVKPSTQE